MIKEIVEDIKKLPVPVAVVLLAVATVTPFSSVFLVVAYGGYKLAKKKREK